MTKSIYFEMVSALSVACFMMRLLRQYIQKQKMLRQQATIPEIKKDGTKVPRVEI